MSLFICGTDTGVGKTHTAAALLARYGSNPKLRYWKPVQTGEESDTQTVRFLSNCSDSHLLPNLYSFREPLSPHRAAELEKKDEIGTTVDINKIIEKYYDYKNEGPLLVEGAGGLLVPLNRQETWMDFLISTKVPVLIAARSGLGTINHCLLTIEALRARKVGIAGIVFCGPRNEDNIRTVLEFSGVTDCIAFDFPGAGDLSSFDAEKICQKYLQG